MRYTLLALLLFAGCVRVPVVPVPPTPDATEMDRYFSEFRVQIGIALGKTADGVDGLDEVAYRKLFGANLKAAAEAAHGELSATDQALSDGGYTPEKAKALLRRRQQECTRGQ